MSSQGKDLINHDYQVVARANNMRKYSNRTSWYTRNSPSLHLENQFTPITQKYRHLKPREIIDKIAEYGDAKHNEILARLDYLADDEAYKQCFQVEILERRFRILEEIDQFVDEISAAIAEVETAPKRKRGNNKQPIQRKASVGSAQRPKIIDVDVDVDEGEDSEDTNTPAAVVSDANGRDNGDSVPESSGMETNDDWKMYFIK